MRSRRWRSSRRRRSLTTRSSTPSGVAPASRASRELRRLLQPLLLPDPKNNPYTLRGFMFEARIAPTPKDTVFRDGKANVYRFRGSAKAGSHVPVLLVPSMINRWYVVDLREG